MEMHFLMALWISAVLHPVVLQPGRDMQSAHGISPVPAVTLMYPDRKLPRKCTWRYLYLCLENKPVQVQKLFHDLGHLLFVLGTKSTSTVWVCNDFLWLLLSQAVAQPLGTSVPNHHLSTSHYWQEKQSLLTSCSLSVRKTVKIIMCHWKQSPPFGELK